MHLFKGYSSTRNGEGHVVSLNFSQGAALIPALALTCPVYRCLVTMGAPSSHWPGRSELGKTELGTMAPSAAQV